MGLELSSLVVTALTKEQGHLTSAEFKVFWEQTTQDANGVIFLNEVIKTIHLILDGKADPSMLDSLVLTLSFISTHLKVDTKRKELKTVLSEWKQKKQLAAPYPYLTSIMNDLVADSESKTKRPDGSPAKPFGQLLLQCSTMYSLEEYKRLVNIVKYPTCSDADLSYGDQAVIFAHLMNIASLPPKGERAEEEAEADAASPEQPPLDELLELTLNKMLTLPHQMKMNPKVAETTLLALLHILKQLCCLTSVIDTTFLRRAINTAQQFYLWPAPYGNYTRNILLFLQREMHAPGAAVRDRLLAEANSVRYSLPPGWRAEDLGDDDVPPDDNEEDLLGSTIFYLWDKSDAYACAWANALQCPVFDPKRLAVASERKKSKDRQKSAYAGHWSPCNTPLGELASSSCADPLTQSYILLNMLDNDVGLSASEFDTFKSLSSKSISALFVEAMEVLSRVEAHPDQAKEIRVKGLVQMKKRLNKLLKEPGGAATEGQFVQFPPRYTPDSLPPLPPIAHVDLNVSQTYKIQPADGSKSAASLLPLPKTDAFDRLEQLVEAALASQSKPFTIRLVIAGGDGLLHNLLCAFIQILQSKSDRWKDDVRLKFYILPCRVNTENHLAGFLARHDSWFFRHLFTPFRAALPVVPFPKPEFLKFVEDVKAPPNIMSKYLRGLVDSYIRSGEECCPVMVYKCEVWMWRGGRPEVREGGGESAENEEAASLMIPMLQRVELGIQAASEFFRNKLMLEARDKKQDIGKIQNMSEGDLYQQKGWNFVGVEATLRFTKMDLRNQIVEQPSANGNFGVYNNVIVANVPRQGDLCFPPDPTLPTLEMFAQNARNTPANNVFKMDARQQILSLTAESYKEGFHALIDGQLFGPFYRLRVSQMTARDITRDAVPSNTPVTFPVQTFFPLDG